MENIFKERNQRLQVFNNRRNKVVFPRTVKEIPDNVFMTCSECGVSLPVIELKNNFFVCNRCNNHLKINAYQRLDYIIDKGTFREFDRFVETKNKDNFIGYDEKLSKYKENTGLKEAVITGLGEIDSKKCIICIMDSNFMMGSMGSIVGEKLTRAIEFATLKELPLIISCTSGGARMQEGIISLMQMSKTSAALKRHADAKLLYISILTHPTTGGVSASFAMLGDIIISEPNALVGFAGKRVIEKTVNEVLPKEFQSAEFVLEKGFIDLIVDRKKMKSTLSFLLDVNRGK